MHRILPARQPWPLHGLASSRAIEARALALPGLPAQALMQRAGEAVARLSLAIAPHARHTWVLAGPGNNGGDGFEAACALRARGRAVQVGFIGDVQGLRGDAAAAWQRAQAAGVPVQAFVHGSLPALGPEDIAIDALLGLGGLRPLDGPLALAAQALNALPCPVLAVDLPTGLNGDTGQPTGQHVVRATHTLALLTLKPGLFTGQGRELAGTVWLDELRVPAAIEAGADAWLAGPPHLPPARRHDQHKGSFGDLLVVGGAPGMAGAAWLAARAAHAAGAGRVWVVPLDPGASMADPMRPELMWRTGVDAVDEDHLAKSTVVCGCGGGEAVGAVLPRLLAAVPRLLLDADALNAVAASTGLQQALSERASRGLVSVLTPHPLEAARLLGSTTARVQSDRLAAADALASRYGCVVVLKGSGSVIAAPGLPTHLNPTGNASLASPGTGDVLAGWLGGSWCAASGSGPGSGSGSGSGSASGADTTLAFDTARTEVWQHGAAAEAAGQRVMRAGDLVERLAATPNR